MTSPTDPRLLPVGSVLAQRYRLLRVIGSGAMGTVFEAETTEGQRVAVKTLHEQANGTQATELLTRFIREAQVSSSLSSPHIVQTIDGGIDAAHGVPFLVMELLLGEDLGSLSQRLGPLHPTTAVRMILQAGRGLSVAHKAGVVHRDIKPSNLFLAQEGPNCVVKVCDFGIAKQQSEELQQLTATGVRLGSPLYMSPEQVRSAKSAGPRSDIWSLAMSLYEALAGRPALNHLTTFTELVLWLTMEDIPHLQEAAPWIEPQLATIVHAALLREPDDRCPTVDAFLAALEPHAGGGSALTPFMLKGPPPESQGYRALRASYPTSWKTALASLVETAGATGGLQVTGRSGGVDGQSLVGQVLGGRYRLEKLLGKGGMGAVYECVDEKDPARQHHAIKVVLGAEPNADAMRRFVREARAAMSIQSEHVVRVIDADTDSDRGTPFIVMELLHGEDLDQLVKQHGALEPSAAARVFIEAARGLATAHEMGVVHRDIKPANIFLHELPGGQIVVKICDFGVAKQTSLDTSQTSELTHTGGIIGSPMFMSPEQAKSAKHVDHRTDIWSLSISMYQALAGQKPWDSGGALGELIIAICTQDLTPLQDVAPWVSPTLADVIHRGIQRNPAERYAQISELAAALEPFALPAEKLDRAALINLTESRRSLVAERATGLGASRSRSTTMSSLRELESSMSRSMASQVQAPPAPARPVWVPVAAAAVVALGVVGGALALRGSGGATGASSAATAVTSGPVASQTASASAPASIASIAPAVAPRITGRLVVKPSTARVTVNGEPRELTRQGEVLLEGAAGDLFEVAADTGKARSEMRVTLSRDGTVSPGVLVVVGALVGPGLPLGKPTTSPGKTPVTTPTDTPVTPKPRETF